MSLATTHRRRTAYRHLDQWRESAAFRAWRAPIAKPVRWQLEERESLLRAGIENALHPCLIHNTLPHPPSIVLEITHPAPVEPGAGVRRLKP
ncbi:MAG: hypothetical protein WB762_07945 [Candidatus Sulfotelmatobacter sp.]